MAVRRKVLAALLAVLVAPDVVPGGAADRGTEPGGPVDVAPFGAVRRVEPDGGDLGVRWEDPRDVQRVVVTFAEGERLPAPRSLRVEYWRGAWPLERIRRDRPTGGGEAGWHDVGDWFQGRWQVADTRLAVAGRRYTFTFRPVDEREFPEVNDDPSLGLGARFDARYRTTLQLRVVGRSPLPAIESFETFTDSTWDDVELELEWGGTRTPGAEQVWDGRLEVHNGATTDVRPLSAASRVVVAADGSWRSIVREAVDGVRARVRYTRTPNVGSFDDTVVTVRATHEAFSFRPADVVAWGHVFVPDLGVLVRTAGRTVTYDAARAAWQATDPAARDLYSRVALRDEQTFAGAWRAMPAKPPRYVALGFEGARQHFRLDERGRAEATKTWQSRVPGPDSPRCRWDGERIEYDFGLPGERNRGERLDDGAPIFVSEWDRDGVRYRQTAFVVPLGGVPAGPGEVAPEDPTVLLVRLDMAPAGAAEGHGTETEEKDTLAQVGSVPAAARERGAPVARVALRSRVDGRPEPLRLDGPHLLAGLPDGGERLRGRILSVGSPAQSGLAEDEGGVTYRARLSGRSPARRLDVAIPFVTLEPGVEWERLAAIDFDDTLAAARAYWRARLARGTRVRTPEPRIDEFFRAHGAHLLINTEPEVGNPRHAMAKVGTLEYGVYPNESVMMIGELERRGHTALAERAFQTWLDYQGSVGLPGDFASQAGVLYGAGGYEAGGYNQSHGWVLRGLAEHYRFTRDAEWLRAAAPRIVRACDWVAAERRRTIEVAAREPQRAIERGLLPPGRLEDVADWRPWLSTNVYTWRGIRDAAAALADIDHPEARRLRAEAAAYRQDILAAADEARRRSPVVRLRDGSWIPHVPSEVHRRGRSFGWIAETLAGSIHLVCSGILDPWDRRATWILRDYEDNRYLSARFGYAMAEEQIERHWFDRGGVSQQANLLCAPTAYLLREQPEHFLRAYFNAFAVSYFPDTRLMTEHALEFGGFAGDHFKTSDEANSAYWLRAMFLQERGDELWVGAALPRAWLADGNEIGIDDAVTYFGRTSVSYVSRDGWIEATIERPDRAPAPALRVWFRHPDRRRIRGWEQDGRPGGAIEPDGESLVLPPGTGRVRLRAWFAAPPREPGRR